MHFIINLSSFSVNYYYIGIITIENSDAKIANQRIECYRNQINLK